MVLTCPRRQCTPHWWQRPGWPGTRCRGPWCGSWKVNQSWAAWTFNWSWGSWKISLKITCRWHSCQPQCPKPTVQQHSTSSPDPRKLWARSTLYRVVFVLPQIASFLFQGLQRDLHLHWHHQPRGRCQHPSLLMWSEIYIGNYLERGWVNDQSYFLPFLVGCVDWIRIESLYTGTGNVWLPVVQRWQLWGNYSTCDIFLVLLFFSWFVCLFGSWCALHTHRAC